MAISSRFTFRARINKLQFVYMSSSFGCKNNKEWSHIWKGACTQFNAHFLLILTIDLSYFICRILNIVTLKKMKVKVILRFSFCSLSLHLSLFRLYAQKIPTYDDKHYKNYFLTTQTLNVSGKLLFFFYALI